MDTELELIKKMDSNHRMIRERFDVLQEKYANEFVAIENGRVLDHDRDMRILVKRLEMKRGDLTLVLVEFIPEKGTQILY